MNSHERWNEAVSWEASWWAGSNRYSNSDAEKRKHHVMAERMGLSIDDAFRIDLAGRSVVDVGGGPASLLLNTYGGGDMLIVDPFVNEWPNWVRERYECAGIRTLSSRGEDFDSGAFDFDEAWIYNCLQHVEDPKAVIEKTVAAMKFGGTLRMFEWVNTGVYKGHIHDLSGDFLVEAMEGVGLKECSVDEFTQDWGNGDVTQAFAGVFTKPLLSASRETAPKRKERTKVDRSKRMNFHILSIPHTVTDSERYSSCAFSMKVSKLCKMLSGLGHDVYHYGCEGAKVEAKEVVDVVSDEFRMASYPDQEDMSKQYQFNLNDEYHDEFNRKCIEEVEKRKGPRDFLLCPWGVGHEKIAKALSGMYVVESGIGYPRVFSDFKVFESYWWMAHVYGNTMFNGDGNWYDCVIPNQFYADEFDYGEDREDWYLYLGRIIKRKGIEVAVQTTERIGAKLVIAGQGKIVDANERIDLRASHVEFVGYADVEKRRDLLRRAKAIFMPTYFLEPFGGVMIEGFMSGCPCISSDWGAFTENNLHGITGYRCRTMDHFCWAAENIGRIRPSDCRSWAMDNFSIEACAPKYEEYFRMLQSLDGGGWYEPNPKRTDLDWLKRKYPNPGDAK